MNSLMGVVHLMGFAIGYGICVWMTFVSSHVLAEALPKQQFGIVQSKIYPIYFRAMACSIGVSLVAFSASQAGTFECYNLIASVAMVLCNLVYLEPRATKVMFERMKIEKEEGRGRNEDGAGRVVEKVAMKSKRGKLNMRLKRLNTYSSFVNGLTLMALTWHLVYLGQRLHMTS